MHKSLNFEELLALYAISDACIVTSTRDGMNLVSFEYIASQRDRYGSLILSEFTGAAQSFNGSLIINPWNAEEMSNAIYDAVTMSPEQRMYNHSKLDSYVQQYTSAWWGKAFIDELIRCSTEHSGRKKSVHFRSQSSESIADGQWIESNDPDDGQRYFHAEQAVEQKA